jgi:hypothetical protein
MASQVAKMKLPDLVPFALPGAHSHIPQVRCLATAKRTILLLSYRKEVDYAFSAEDANWLFKCCLRMCRTERMREYSVWLHQAGTWLGENVICYSKKAWVMWAYQAAPEALPYMSLREAGKHHTWTREELVPLMQCDSPQVRLIVLELMSQSK